MESLLKQSGYCPEKTKFLVDGFQNGFSIGYNGPKNIQQTAPNLPLNVGTEADLWNKVMKEVKLKRFAGPYEKVPFDNFIQSPIGLVPKDGGMQTRLTFHLSYPRTGRGNSVNASTPQELCKVHYSDFDAAIARCLTEGKLCKLGKSDVQSTFRNLGILPEHWKYLIMKAKCPIDGKIYYFVDKCLPFGASISCALFQAVSDAIAHIVTWRVGMKKIPVNYLDDFLFAALMQWLCDHQINIFMQICADINLPVNLDKTVWSTTRLTFLGLLIDMVQQMIFLPREKILKGRYMIGNILNRKSKKVTVKEIQQLTGFLNFLSRAIILGRAFTRRIYAFATHKGKQLKPHNHVKVNHELRLDLEMWNFFLHHQSIYARPFLDLSKELISTEIDMSSDASRNSLLGMGATCQSSWCYQQWERHFIEKFKPSIEYLELYGVLSGVILWIHRFKNMRITLFCDNQSVVHMVNSTTSSCKNCMVLIRLLVLEGLTNNVRIRAKYIASVENIYSDALSRINLKKFHDKARINGKIFDDNPTQIPEQIWPMSKIWLQ